MGKEDRVMKVMKFVYCMSIDEIANRSRDKNECMSCACTCCKTGHSLRADELACGASRPAHPTNGGPGPRTQGYQKVCSRQIN